MSVEVRLSWIRLLLENYLDVVQGLRDRKGGDDGLALMCEAWNEPGYQRLEELRRRLRREEPLLYVALSHAYFDPMSRYERRVLACQHPTCQFQVPAWSLLRFHSHPHRHVRLVPRTVKVYRRPVDGERVGRAESWLEQEWGEDVLVPSILRPFLGGAPVPVLNSQASSRTPVPS